METTLAFSGPPGVGKTSTAVALARDLFGKDFRSNLNEYNASDSRGIEFIRSEIRRLVSVTPIGFAYQIIFLDEADELTNGAQTALRQVMMKHTDTTKFILSCNSPEKIIDPIKDRMAILNFKPLQVDVIFEKLRIVCANEHIGFEGGVLEIIAKSSGGSLRKAIQNIEVYRNSDNIITLDNITTFNQCPLEIQGIDLLLQKAFAGEIEGYETQLENLDGGFSSKEILSED